MDIVLLINKLFWGESAYPILMSLCLMWIFIRGKKNDRAVSLAVYSVMALLLVIYNPVVASVGMRFFAEADTGYLRIYYLLPLMTIIAYGIADYYGSVQERKRIIFAIICIVIVLSGQIYGSETFRGVENIYKISQNALEISEAILADKEEERARILVPNEDDISYGIRQYTYDIVLAGYSDAISEEDDLVTLETEKEFTYVVVKKGTEPAEVLESSTYELLLETNDYYLYERVM